MAKSSKSQSPEFLAERRKAIADRAKQRRRQVHGAALAASAASAGSGTASAKVGPPARSASAAPHNH